jgi:phage baseplate assembly protein V
MRDMQRHLQRALAGIRLAFRGVMTLNNSAPPVQLAQLDGLNGEQLQDAELMQHYGLTSHPPPGTECVVLPLGGRTSHGIIIATEHGTFRLKNLAPGETAIYDDQGQSVHLTRGGIVINGAGLPVTVRNTPNVVLDTPLLSLSGNLELGGSLVAQGDIRDHGHQSMAGMRATYDSHTHTDPQGGEVSTPSATM